MKLPPIRFWIGVMVFMTTFTNYMMRSNISVSIISMVKHNKNTTFTPPCLREISGNDTVELKTAENDSDSVRYAWSETEQGYILAAYFWGYMTTCFPGGIVSEMLGPWNVILWTSILSAALTGLTPLAAQGGVAGVVACRFFIGLLGGFIYPALNVLIARWAPPKEKGKFLAALMGNTLGTVCTWPLVGVVTDLLSWEWGFYVLVIIMSVYCLVFFILVSDSPQKHRWITEEEQRYITECQEGQVSTTKAVPPYLKISMSLPFWALIVAQFGNLWGLNLILTYAPKFMAETLGFNLKKSSAIASLPYLARLFSSQIFGIAGDHMRKKGNMSVTRIRKIFVIFSHLIPAASLFLIRAAGCNHIGVIVLLVLNQAFNGAVVVGHLINSQDLSPNFAGTLYGIMNFVAGTSGFIVPPITGALTDYYV
ncbi:MFS 1 and/or Sugar tr domain containing protein [Asbolus verrucosus]|uniref:MFS 1 and/or Sugar tr domain containing protein n=1 Tax=Asbolus verrucosus TaxID=1661398 RepID=A0A482WCX0_ASBVE|nr:MFS 1 and/or Sugar tr domain containing protein [Asbolus verrucosus]